MRQLYRHKLRYRTRPFVCACITLFLLIATGLLIVRFSNRLAKAALTAQISETSLDRVWTNIRANTRLAAEQRGFRAFTALQLDQAKLKQLLAAAPMEFTAEAK